MRNLCNWRDKLDTKIKEIPDNVLFHRADSWEPLDPDVPIEDTSTKLEKSVVKAVGEFYLQYRLALEYIRTQLFRIYVECSKHKGIARKKDLENINKYLYNGRNINILDRLNPMLWEYLSKWEHNDHLIINSDWLRCYLGIKILDSQCLKDYLKEGLYTPEETLSFFKHFSTFLLFILHCIRNHGDPAFLKFSDTDRGFEDVVESEIYLLSELAHVDGELGREIRLFEDTMKIWSSEAILYTVSNAYREHLHHALDCCVLGLVLLDTDIYTKLCPDCKPIWPNADLLKNWILIGLLHDVGYSLGICYQVINHIKFLKSPQMEEFKTNLQTFLEKLGKDTYFKIKQLSQIQAEEGKKLNHEIISALHILYLKRTETDVPDKSWASEINTTVNAIQQHHSRGITINPKDEPLSFLLLLCDQLQEWDRPRVDSLELRKHISTQLLRPERKEIEQNTLLRQLKTNLRVNVKECGLEWGEDRLVFYLLFNDASEEGFEPAVIWAEKSYNFQNVRIDSLNVDIEIQMLHPLAKVFKEEGLDFTEMDLFQYFVREEEKASTLYEWLRMSRLSQNGLQYTINAEEAVESYLINLKKLSEEKNKVIPYFPEELYTTYSVWKKHYLHEAKLKKRKE